MVKQVKLPTFCCDPIWGCYRLVSRAKVIENQEVEEDEEEENLAPPDSTIVASLAVDHVSSAEETEPFETNKSTATPPPPAYRTTSRVYVRTQIPISFPSEAEVARLLALPTPSPSLLTFPFEGLSDIVSPIVGGPPVMLEDPYAYIVAAFQAPPSPDYVSGPEYPPSPEFVPEPVYPDFMPAKDDILPAEEQPLPATASPAIGSDPDEDPKDDPEEDPANYPADGGDEGDDEDESSDDDEDDDIDIKGDEESNEYLAPADSTASVATPPPHPASHVTARMSIRPQTPISLPSNIEIARLIAIPTPPPSPLSLLSSPLPQILSLPLPLLSPPPTDPIYEEAPLGYRVARLRWRAEREEIPEADLPLQRRLCTAHIGTYELGESSAAATIRLMEPVRDGLYRFVDTVERGEGPTPAAMEVGYEEKHDDQALQRARVNRLFRDRRFYAHTARLMEGEARASRMARTQSMDASDAARFEVIALRTQVSAQRTEITDLRAADCRFQTTVGTQQEEIKELRAAHRKLQA
nr:hypothetical protein [Tanacetum cinerariifolium]